jgi:hypothetical protein
MNIDNSKRLKLLILVMVLGVTLANPLHCQNAGKIAKSSDLGLVPDSQTSKSTGFSDIYIPPLGQLIDSALNHSPLLDEQTALMQMRQWQQKSINDEWGRYFLFFSEMRYGSIDILVSNGGTVTYGDKSNSTRYNVGARVQLSIFDLLDMKQKKGVAREQYNFEKEKKEELKKMISEDVIKLWNKLIAYKEIVSINEDHIAVQSSNSFYAEQQFKAGDIPLLEYARIKEISIKAEQEYQLAKKEFREAYLLLESLIGVKLSAMKPN